MFESLHKLSHRENCKLQSSAKLLQSSVLDSNISIVMHVIVVKLERREAKDGKDNSVRKYILF
jgi:hypothetical protein